MSTLRAKNKRMRALLFYYDFFMKKGRMVFDESRSAFLNYSMYISLLFDVLLKIRLKNKLF